MTMKVCAAVLFFFFKFWVCVDLHGQMIATHNEKIESVFAHTESWLDLSTQLARVFATRLKRF